MEETANPIIIQDSIDKPRFGISLPPNLPQYIFMVLAIIVVGELIWGIWYITRPLSALPGAVTNTQAVQVEEKPKALISLSGPSSATQGSELLVDVSLSSKQASSFGTDLVLKYNPAYLNLAEPSQTVFTPGEVYPDYIGQEIDNQTGTYRISGISSNLSGQIAEGKFGTIKFKVLKSGQTTISVDFEQGSTSDSNVISLSGEDVLYSVDDIIINIR